MGTATSNGGSEAYAELEKALNIVGDYRLNTANNTLRFAVENFVGPRGSADIGVDRDYSSIISHWQTYGGPIDAGTSEKPVAPFSSNVGSACFAMATSLETTNGLEISGLNAEEQSDISLLVNWSGAQTTSNVIEVYTYYDAMIVLRENNILELIQ